MGGWGGGGGGGGGTEPSTMSISILDYSNSMFESMFENS